MASLIANRNVDSPLSWPLSTNIQRFKSANNGNEGELNASVSDDKRNAEKSKFEESLMLMKYYYSPAPSSGHNGLELDLPIELTDEQRRIIFYPRSKFVLGRFGTGKTTVLTTKLIQNEKLHHVAVEAVYATANATSQEHESQEIADEIDRPVLRQLFVTLSPELCQEVKHHVSRSKRCVVSSVKLRS